ncbi:MAG: PAS domain-containing protein [Sphingomonadales bacterium]|nr:PAS domain-containing protein [Sphingomonadales bacterium]
MVARDTSLTGTERTFDRDEFIVSKTNLKGHLTYANDVFLRLGGYTEEETLGAPHSLIRHPDMPRAVFKLLWDQIQAGKEIFAYVLNRSKNGDHYWVLAHVTPTVDTSGNIIGYHSNRRVPTPQALATIKPIYDKLLGIEKAASDRKVGMEQSCQALVDLLEENGVTYDQFVLSI